VRYALQTVVSIGMFIWGVFLGLSNGDARAFNHMYVPDLWSGILSILGPFFLCLLFGCIAVGKFNRAGWEAAWRLLYKFGFGLAAGYGYATWNAG
jgi:hypothetical protein